MLILYLSDEVLNCNCIRSSWTIDARSIYQFVKINCICINILGYDFVYFLVISSGGTITLADANCFAALLEGILAKKDHDGIEDTGSSNNVFLFVSSFRY